MEKIKLTKREYLGDGYAYVFRNLKSKEEKVVFCSKEDYEKMSGVDGHLYNPIPEDDYEYVMSYGGFPLLNTEDSIGNNLDGFIKDGTYNVFEIDEKSKQLNLVQYSEEEFNSKYIWQ